MDFQEYMLAINATTLSSPEDKLTWVFNVFDGDGGGTIDATEINTMMVGLFEMAGAKVNEEQLAVRLFEPKTILQSSRTVPYTDCHWICSTQGVSLYTSFME